MESFVESFMLITDVGCDADDILASVHVLNILRHLEKPARIAFVLTMLNPVEKSKFLTYLISLFDKKGIQHEITIYLAEGYETLEQATDLYPNFPPRFGDVYNQLEGIPEEELQAVDGSIDIFPVSRLGEFTDRCEDGSIHLLVLSPLPVEVDCLDFKKINLGTAHMMGGVADRNGVTKIGYNCGVNPVGFQKLCQQTGGKLTVVTTATCDAVRRAVDFPQVKECVELTKFGEFIFARMMSWHHYITKQQTNFANCSTPCISDLVAADVFMQAVFPEEYPAAMMAIVSNASSTEVLDLQNCVMMVEKKPGSMCMNLAYKGSYLDDNDGQLFRADAKKGETLSFQEAVLAIDQVPIEEYATFLVMSVFTH